MIRNNTLDPILKYFLLIIVLSFIQFCFHIIFFKNVINLCNFVFLFGVAIFLIRNAGYLKYREKRYIFITLFIIFQSFLFHPLSGSLDAVKLCIYIIIFFMGGIAMRKGCALNTNRNIYLYLILIIPLIGRFIIQRTEIIGAGTSMSIFVNSNNYVFYGICSSLLIIYYNFEKKYLYLYLLLYVLSSRTLGAFFALTVALVFANFKKISFIHIITFIFSSILVILIVNNVDLDIFIRIRNSFSVIKYLFSEFSIYEIIYKVDYDDYSFLMKADDDTSFLFRLQLWGKIIDALIRESNLYQILFGHGEGSCSSNFVIPHNDYIRIIYDYGILLFFIIANSFYIIGKYIYKTLYIIPFFAVVFYSFSENLLDNLISNSIFYFILGMIYFKYKITSK